MCWPPSTWRWSPRLTCTNQLIVNLLLSCSPLVTPFTRTLLHSQHTSSLSLALALALALSSLSLSLSPENPHWKFKSSSTIGPTPFLKKPLLCQTFFPLHNSSPPPPPNLYSLFCPLPKKSPRFLKEFLGSPVLLGAPF